MASPSQAGSPGSSQGLDARRLEELFGAAERVSEQAGEQEYTWVYWRRTLIYLDVHPSSGSLYSPSDRQWIFIGF